MTKRDLLKEPFTEEELKQWILTDEEIEWMRKGVKYMYEKEPHWVGEEEDIGGQILTDEQWDKAFNRRIKWHMDRMRNKDGKYYRTIIKETKDDLKFKNMKDEELLRFHDTNSFLFAENICCKSMYETSTDEVKQDILDCHFENDFEDCKTYFNLEFDGICKPACICEDCMKTYKNYRKWEKKQ